jgi:hypothetical protein
MSPTPATAGHVLGKANAARHATAQLPSSRCRASALALLRLPSTCLLYLKGY